MRHAALAAFLATLAAAASAQTPQLPQIPALPQIPGVPAAAPAAAPAAPAPVARAGGAILNRDGREIGTVALVEGPRGVVLNIVVREGGLPPGRKGIHIHSVGTCADGAAGFVASGAHLGAPGLPHGLLNTTGDYGDLPNLIVARDGSAEVEMFTSLVSIGGASGRGTLLDADGAAIVVHQNPDDHASQPIGGAGPRLACANIQRQN
jgi:Cu-Zn family superoxide dismutase